MNFTPINYFFREIDYLGWGVPQGIKHSPVKWKALGSAHSTKKKEEEEEEDTLYKELIIKRELLDD